MVHAFVKTAFTLGLSSLIALPALAAPLYSLTVERISGEKESLDVYRGKVLLIVNTASKCGFTPQYADLQKLYERYAPQGFVVLGFPSNDFAGQEPGSNAEIKTFCATEFGVTFPMFAKGSVTGEEKQPLFRLLTEESGRELDGRVMWNFEKFLVGRDGAVRARFGSFTNPLSSRITSRVEELLKEPSSSPSSP